jgi:hypothetical protein
VIVTSEGGLHFFNKHNTIPDARMLLAVPAILQRKLNFELTPFENEIKENKQE